MKQQIEGFYKEAYQGHPPEVWTLGLITLINRMGTMVLPFLTIYLTTVLDFDLAQAGILVGMFGFGSLGGSYIGGKLSDIIGPIAVIIASLALGGAMFFLMAFATSFNSLLILILLAAFFGEAYRPAITAAVGHYTKALEVGRSVAVIRLAINVGMGVAPAVAGFMAVFMSYQWLFWFDSFTCIGAAGYLWYKSRQWHHQPKEQPDMAMSGKEEDVKKPSENREYLLFLLATLLLGFGFVQWFHTVPLFIKTEWGFDERYIGGMKGLSSLLIVLLEMPLVHAVEISRKVKWSILLGTLFFALSFAPFLFAHSLTWLVLAFLLVTMGEITYLPFNNALPLRMAPLSQRGSYISWYWVTWSLASIAGPYWGMAFIERFGFSQFWIFLIAIISLSLLISARLLVIRKET